MKKPEGVFTSIDKMARSGGDEKKHELWERRERELKEQYMTREVPPEYKDWIITEGPIGSFFIGSSAPQSIGILYEEIEIKKRERWAPPQVAAELANTKDRNKIKFSEEIEYIGEKMKNGVVVDLGCGNYRASTFHGLSTAFCSSLYIGVDKFHGTEGFVSHDNHEELHLRRDMLEAISRFGNNCIDVICMSGLDLLPQAGFTYGNLVLNEAERALKPGGILIEYNSMLGSIDKTTNLVKKDFKKWKPFKVYEKPDEEKNKPQNTAKKATNKVALFISQNIV